MVVTDTSVGLFFFLPVVTSPNICCEKRPVAALSLFSYFGYHLTCSAAAQLSFIPSVNSQYAAQFVSPVCFLAALLFNQISDAE